MWKGRDRVLAKVFLGCCGNSFLMEVLMSRAAHMANLITFLQFLCISLSGFVFTAKFGMVRPSIPLSQYALLVALFFITNVANNYVYVLHVPSTLHMIIRSASLPASMLVSWHAKKRVPKLSNVVGSILVSIGVATAMYGGASLVNENTGIYLHWCLGVAILLSTLFLGAFTGLQQEKLYQKFGKHPDEMLFYTNVLPLPLFMAMYPSLKETASEVNLDMWILIALNIASQFICAHSVHELATTETSVTVTLILTLRKFTSLLISAVVFKSNLTLLHFAGSLFVVFGTCVYFDYFAYIANGDKRIKTF